MNLEEMKTSLAAIHEFLSQGKFIEAMDQFLDDDVVLQEVGGQPKQGKKFCMEFEAEFLETVSEFGGYRVSNVGFGDNLSFYEAVMEYTLKDGTEVRMEQCVVDEWSDGKIVRERFYHS